METITNLASTAANTASKLIYGDTTTAAADTTTKNNETGGMEPISGEQGKGTVTEPFDQGNAATPLEKPSGLGGLGTSGTSGTSGTFLDYSNQVSSGQEPISGLQGKGTAGEPFDQGNSLNPTDSSSSSYRPSGTSTDTYTSNFDSNPVGGTHATGITDKVWKPAPVDNVSTSVISSAPVDPLTSERAGSDHPFEKSSYDSFEKPSHDSYEKPSYDSYDKSSSIPFEKSSSSPFEHSGFASTGQSSQFPTGVPAPIEQSGFAPTQQSDFAPIQQSDFASTQQSGFAPVEKSGFAPTEQSGFAPTEQSGFAPSEQSKFSSDDRSKIPVPVRESEIASTSGSGMPAVDTAPLEYKYPGSGTPDRASDVHEAGVINDSNAGFGNTSHNPVGHHHDTKTGAFTGSAVDGTHSGAGNPVTSGETNRLAGEKSSYQSGSMTSPTSTSSAGTNQGAPHESKMSKIMDKLHIGHK
ncbi:hypothetical protein P153DRAFT_368823 [Dothidotthia symphoricarpi CBS 119687]|uniref:Uncharacterized protein n=1 Tax=Dothidotthia symphoricarpi CBS 119687 TaxID=1392245 RepID=A0A6A6A6G5_9PLEO|nr:uncharacterized protein P153DRAFT_368823 [Dothidotthia symphoricarpi CBS 119687]KAF2126775.1 hypothetical protein P153DRAFT_368823 [Dothidotthia symphoricarpi CBS 119687]